ncbi:unnamed protein product [Mytilus edulis]|uniref:Uncharacterized protein n=1 Tax=Mytilus edulis TaxID=6550 RepID=A0A8S3RS57_MYTED|nr:unnamed protein product [Mytilus edulis]
MPKEQVRVQCTVCNRWMNKKSLTKHKKNNCHGDLQYKWFLLSIEIQVHYQMARQRLKISVDQIDLLREMRKIRPVRDVVKTLPLPSQIDLNTRYARSSSNLEWSGPLRRLLVWLLVMKLAQVISPTRTPMPILKLKEKANFEEFTNLWVIELQLPGFTDIQAPKNVKNWIRYVSKEDYRTVAVGVDKDLLSTLCKAFICAQKWKKIMPTLAPTFICPG